MEYIYQISAPNSSYWLDVTIAEYNKYRKNYGYNSRVCYGVQLSPFDMWWNTLTELDKVQFHKSHAIIAFNAGADSK